LFRYADENESKLEESSKEEMPWKIIFKGRRSEREIKQATLEKVRGAIRPTSLLWREACSAHSKIKREELARTRQKASGKRVQQTHDSS
jgi:hypothetical protein